MSKSAVSSASCATDTLIQQLLEIVGGQLSIPAANLQPDTPLESLGITSVDVVAIVWAIEERFSVEIDLARMGEGAVRAIRDVAALASAVQGALQAPEVVGLTRGTAALTAGAAAVQPAGYANVGGSRRARSLTVLVPSGARVHMRAWESDGDAGLPACVMLHGFGDCSRVWDRCAQTLAGVGPLLAVDLKGHGESSWDPDGDYRLESYVGDLADALSHLGPRPMVLIGHSLGGMLCMKLAADHGLDVLGLLLVDASPWHSPTSIRHMLRMFREAHRAYDSVAEFTSALVTSRPMSDPAAIRHYAPHLLIERGAHWWPRADGRLAEGSDLGSAAVEEGLGQALRRCRCPALLVRGGRSGFVSQESARRVSDLLPGCELVELAGAGHAVMLDQPEAFAQLAGDFLQRLAVRSDRRPDAGAACFA